MKKVIVNEVKIPGKPKYGKAALFFPIKLHIKVRRCRHWMEMREECIKLHEGDRLYAKFVSTLDSSEFTTVLNNDKHSVGFTSPLSCYDPHLQEKVADRPMDSLFVLRAMCRIKQYLSIRLISTTDPVNNHFADFDAVLSIKEFGKAALPSEIDGIEDAADVTDSYDTAVLQALFTKYESLYPPGVSDATLEAAKAAPPKKKEPLAPRYEKLRAEDLQVGTRFRFGSEKKPWVVLKLLEDRVLVIAEDCVSYTEWRANSRSDFTWERSMVRYLLNENYYHKNFTDEERKCILLTHHRNPSNKNGSIDGGNDTDDYLFVPSTEEVKELIPDTRFREREMFWWTRTPGSERYYYSFVGTNGRISTNGIVEWARGVRPCMWLRLPK